MENIVIIGASGHAKVVLDIVQLEGRYRVVGLVDRFRAAGETLLGYSILGKEEDLPQLVTRHQVKGVTIAIGDNFVRARVAAEVAQLCPELPLVSAVHPRSSLGLEASIGAGTVIMAGVVINSCCKVGVGCIVNTNASLGHDCSLEDFGSLAPNVATGGNCRIGRYSAIGIGASVIHGVTVGQHTVVGAGAVVVDDLGSNLVAFGVPAKVVRHREAGEKYL